MTNTEAEVYYHPVRVGDRIKTPYGIGTVVYILEDGSISVSIDTPIETIKIDGVFDFD